MMDGGSKRGFYGLATYPVDGVSSREGIRSSLVQSNRNLAPESSRILIDCALLLFVNYMNFLTIFLVQVLLLLELMCLYAFLGLTES